MTKLKKYSQFIEEFEKKEDGDKEKPVGKMNKGGKESDEKDDSTDEDSTDEDFTDED